MVDNRTRPCGPATTKGKALASSAGYILFIEILSAFKGQVAPEISYYDPGKIDVNVVFHFCV